jgi:hypothetical protein
MSTCYPDGNRETPLGDGAAPDFMAALALPHQFAAGRSQEIPQDAIELRSHSSGNRIGLAQRRDLKEQRGWIDVGMIERQKIERHG